MTPPDSVIRARLPAVAGLFYPDDPYELRAVIQGYLDAAAQPAPQRPKAIVVPHAGYVYSGPVAASAYRGLVGHAASVGRVVLAGPSHRIPVPGIAVPEVAAFDTPLGRVPIDSDAIAGLLDLPGVFASNLPHRMEHSLEVQLPFLQMTLGDFALIPLAVGDAAPGDVARVLDACWGGPETLVVISSDLSHYLDYESARRTDQGTAGIIVARSGGLGDEQACGCRVLNGLMEVARRRNLRVEALDLRNSGDTSGDRSRVVGYGAFALYGD
jgi:AmmeMemoRadiSam system protein B